jgi:hypothetical protein
VDGSCSADIPGRGGFYTYRECLAERIDVPGYDPEYVVLALATKVLVIQRVRAIGVPAIHTVRLAGRTEATATHGLLDGDSRGRALSEPCPPRNGGSMSLDANKELVRKHIDFAWNDATFDALDEVWADECVVHLANGHDVVGLEALKEPLRSVVLPWSDRVCRVEELVAERALVANRWTFRAAGPSGGRITMTGMDIYRVDGGRLTEEWIALGAPLTDG